jgi:SHS2 domain-containing protein
MLFMDPPVAGSFELFDHTADMGIRVRAKTREGLLWPAAAGLYAAFGELVAGATTPTSFTFHEQGGDEAVLLRDFLTELLILFEREHKILASIESASFGDGELTVSGQAAEVDVERSVYCREVKAVTYHDLSIREVDGEFEARLIVDI